MPTFNKRMALCAAGLSLLLLLTACASGASPTPEAPSATLTPEATLTPPPAVTDTAQPATATKPAATATTTNSAVTGTPSGSTVINAALISPQTADGLKSVAQFQQDAPASQWLWGTDGKLIVSTVNGYYHYDLAALKDNGFTSSDFLSPEHIIATSADGSMAAAQQQDGSLQIWDLAKLKPTQTLQLTDTLSGATFSPDGKTLAVTSADTITVTLWDVSSGKQTKTLTGFDTAAPTYHVQFSPDGRSLAWIARATAQFMDISSGTLGSRLSFEDFINSLVFSPDGKNVAIAVEDFVSLRQVSDGSELHHLTLSDPAFSLAYSPDGRLLAVAVGNGINLVNSASGQVISTLTGHTSPVRAASFAPDGRSLVSGDDQGNVFIWRAQP